jgi:hypothetical protein
MTDMDGPNKDAAAAGRGAAAAKTSGMDNRTSPSATDDRQRTIYFFFVSYQVR